MIKIFNSNSLLSTCLCAILIIQSFNLSESIKLEIKNNYKNGNKTESNATKNLNAVTKMNIPNRTKRQLCKQIINTFKYEIDNKIFLLIFFSCLLFQPL